MAPHRLLLLLSFLVALPPAADAWQVHVGTGYGDDAASAVAFDAQRNVLAAGATRVGGDGTGSATVVKLARNGKLLWKTLVAGDGSESTSVAIDAAGDVVVGGFDGGIDESYRGHFTVTKLAGATGAVLWRHAEPSSTDGVLHLDAAGDVIVSAWTDLVVYEGLYDCAKLSGRDGAEEWRVSECGLVRAGDAAGNVVVTSYGTAKKILGATGATAWEAALDEGASFGGLDPAGDVFLATGSALVKLDGATGAREWTVVDPTLGGPIAGMSSLAVDRAGDVVLGGMTAYRFDPLLGNDMLVVKRSGADGGERWRRTFTSDVVGIESAHAVAVDGRGGVTAVGTLRGGDFGSVCHIVRLDGRSGKTRWERGLRGTRRMCVAVAVDPIGNFAVGGRTDPPVSALGTETSATFVVARGTGWSGQGLRPVRVLP